MKLSLVGLYLDEMITFLQNNFQTHGVPNPKLEYNYLYLMNLIYNTIHCDLVVSLDIIKECYIPVFFELEYISKEERDSLLNWISFVHHSKKENDRIMYIFVNPGIQEVYEQLIEAGKDPKYILIKKLTERFEDYFKGGYENLLKIKYITNEFKWCDIIKTKTSLKQIKNENASEKWTTVVRKRKRNSKRSAF